MKAGDEVRVRKNGDAGIIGEIDGNVAYLDMDNGVEITMILDDLILESDYQPTDAENRATEEDNAAKCASSQKVLDVLYESIINMGQIFHRNAMAAVVVAFGGSGNDWESLNAYQKMNFISIASGFPLDEWTKAFEKNDGSIGKLQLAALAMFAEQMKE